MTTHLDHDSETVRDQQAAELVQLTNGVSLPLILTGEFEFDANSNPPPSSYLLFLNAGFDDAWEVAGEGPGFTCCQDPDVLNLVSELNIRPNLILFRGDLDVKRIDLVGESQNDRASNALWPSNSAGLAATFRLLGKHRHNKCYNEGFVVFSSSYESSKHHRGNHHVCWNERFKVFSRSYKSSKHHRGK